jgi:hypothetical protein
MAIMLGARYIGVMNIRGRVNCAAPPGRCEAGRRVRPVAGKRLRFLSAWVTRAERRSSRSGRRRAQRDTARKLRVGAEGTSECAGSLVRSACGGARGGTDAALARLLGCICADNSAAAARGGGRGGAASSATGGGGARRRTKPTNIKVLYYYLALHWSM